MRSPAPDEICVPLNGKFTLSVEITDPPDAGYIAVSSWVNFKENITYNLGTPVADEMQPPLCGASAVRVRIDSTSQNPPPAGNVGHGCVTGFFPPLPVSSYVGNFVDLSMTCSSAGSSQIIELLPVGVAPAGSSGSLFVDPDNDQVIPKVDMLHVNCGAGGPLPTDTPTITNTPTLTDTPTNTPCPGPCPTPTPTFTPTPSPTPTTSITDTPTFTPTPSDAEMILVVKAGATPCATPAPDEICVPLDGKFILSVEITDAPDAGFTTVNSWVHFFENLTYNLGTPVADEMQPPLCGSAAIRLRIDSSSQNPPPAGHVGHGCVTGFFPPLPISTYTGNFVDLSMTCSSVGSSQIMELLPVGADPAGSSGSLFKDPNDMLVVPKVGTLHVNCGAGGPLATNTPTNTPGAPQAPPASTKTPTPPPPTSTFTPTPTYTPTPTNTPTPCLTDGQTDTDCDLMPDKFEQEFDACLNPFIPDAGFDPDFDGKANILEYAKGSNPCSGDTDGDGLADGVDSCQLLAEDFDGFQDADGCPDTDNDQDGVLDVDDGCPNVAEDFDAFADDDGCPDPDNDNDGFKDHTDDCPGTDFTAGPDGIADTGDEPLNELGVPIQTKEDYDGVIDNDGCHDSPGDDYDADGIPDDDEVFITLTDPVNPDTDGDGCVDGAEIGTNESTGGSRNPLDPWDFYDVASAGNTFPKDGIVDLANDIMGVILHFAPLGTEPAYDVRFDRGPQVGPNSWNMGPPDGVIDLANDILGVILQFQHNCA